MKNETNYTLSEQLIMWMHRKNITKGQLAKQLNMTPQNLSIKFKKDNLREQDARKIGEALGLKLNAEFVLDVDDKKEDL